MNRPRAANYNPDEDEPFQDREKLKPSTPTLAGGLCEGHRKKKRFFVKLER